MTVLTEVFDYFFSPARPTSLGINLVILAVALVALWRLLKSGLAFALAELNGVADVRRCLAKLQSQDVGGYSPSDSAARSHIADAGATRNALAAMDSVLRAKSPLVADRLRQLAALHRRGDEINQDALAAIVVSELERRTSLARWASTAVVLLGLTGTLFGLSVAVESAGGLLGSGSSATIAQAISAVSATFTGVKVAFSATLLGAISAVILGFALMRIRDTQALLVQSLEELTAIDLVPVFRTSVGVSLAQAAEKVAAMEAELHGALTIVISAMHEHGNSLLNTVDERVRELTTTLERDTRSLLTRFDETSRVVARLIGTSSDVSLADTLTILQAGVINLQQAVDGTASLIPSLEETLARQIDQQTSDISTALTAYTGELTVGVQRQTAAVEAGIRSFDELIPVLGETIARGVDQQTSDINEALHAQGGALQAYAVEQAVQLKQLQGILSGLDTMINTLQSAVATGTTTLTSGHNAVIASAEELKQLRTDIASALDKLPVSVAEIISVNVPRPRTNAPFAAPAPISRVAPAHQSDNPNLENRHLTRSLQEGSSIRVEGNATVATEPKNLFHRWFSGQK